MIASLAFGLAACNSSKPAGQAEINNETKFSSEEYGVEGSPRVTVSKDVPKGGGRYQVGKPYKIKGKWYKPKEDPSYEAKGMASWYGPNFHGRLTANGEIYDQYALSAAHPTMPLPSYARVTNLENQRSVIVRVNDRGPFAHNRIIDLSSRAADLLDYKRDGVANVKVEYVGKARMDGKDERFLMASYRGPGMFDIAPGATQPGTMIALAEEPPAQPLVEAIEKELGPDNSTVLLASTGGIPLPTPRPGLLAAGIPMELYSDPQIRIASLNTLGFAREQRINDRVASAFQQFEARPSKFIPDSDKTVQIVVGSFSDEKAAEAAYELVSAIGIVSKSERIENGLSVMELSLIVGGDVAEPILQHIRAKGLDGASIVEDAREDG